MKKTLYFILCVFSLYACEEIVSVPDISEEFVEVLAPVDGSVLTSTEVIFSWSEIDFADQYQVQIAQPSFLGANQVVLDTLVGDSLQSLRSFSKTLTPNDYEWRIRGLNSNFETFYSLLSFRIDTTTINGEFIDVSDQVIELTAPAQGVVISTTSVNLNWETLPDVSEYEIQIASPDFENPEQIVVDTAVSQSSYTAILEDGDYQWRVRGLNGMSQTGYTTRDFSIATVSDISTETVVLLAPSDGLALNDTSVTFSWEPLDGAMAYDFQIAYPNFDSPIAIVVNETFTTAGNQTFMLEDNTSYQWRVKALNESTATSFTTRDFSINVTEELSEQSVDIIAPENMFETQETSINLSWNIIEQATIYRVIVTNQADNSVFIEQTVADPNLTVLFEIGEYVWAVRGENASENTAYTEQMITILE